MWVHFVTVRFTGFALYHSSNVTFLPLSLVFFYSDVIKSIGVSEWQRVHSNQPKIESQDGVHRLCSSLQTCWLGHPPDSTSTPSTPYWVLSYVLSSPLPYPIKLSSLFTQGGSCSLSPDSTGFLVQGENQGSLSSFFGSIDWFDGWAFGLDYQALR
jgi:hypothetical protein